MLTSFRAHPLMHTTGFILATIPVVVLIPTRPIAPVLITVYVCIGTLQHANLRWTFGPAGRFPARRAPPTRTGLDGRPVPVEQDDQARPALRLIADQLAEPFRA